MESEDLNTPSIKTEIRLFDGEKKIELVEDVDKKEVYSKEAVYFAFPFSMSRPSSSTRFKMESSTRQRICMPARVASGLPRSIGFPSSRTGFRQA